MNISNQTGDGLSGYNGLQEQKGKYKTSELTGNKSGPGQNGESGRLGSPGPRGTGESNGLSRFPGSTGPKEEHGLTVVYGLKGQREEAELSGLATHDRLDGPQGPPKHGQPGLQDKLPCSSNPCKNGAACSSHGSIYSCSCLSGYSGPNCQTKDDSSGIIECKRTNTGYEYTGTTDITQSGFICQRWDSQSPHKHKFSNLNENYCRNPDNEPAPWCYTTNPNKRWEICNITKCETIPEECFRTARGKDYFGSVDVTSSGTTCQRWDSQEPHKHRFSSILGDHGNFCRNPDGENYPWCYTIDPDKRWETCSVPYCGRNPCKTGHNDCQHKCNEKSQTPFYYCSCYKGFYLQNDNKTCNLGSENAILFATNRRVFKISIDVPSAPVKELHALSNHFVGARDLEFDPVTQKVFGLHAYYTSTIYKAHIDGTEQHHFPSTTVKPNDITVDWIGRLIFVCTYRTISKSDLESFKLEIVKSGLLYPSVDLDPFHSVLYFSMEGRLARSDYDGSNTETIIHLKLRDYPKVTVDYVLGKVYFYTDGGNRIEELELDGSKRREILVNTSRIRDFTVQGDFFVWGDFHTIRKTSRMTGLTTTIYSSSDLIRSITSANIQTTDHTEPDKRLDNIAKCWNFGWIRLQRDMLCNRIPDCYGELDEFYCCYAANDCGVQEVSLTCKPNDNEMLYKNLTLDFVEWETHPFSNIFRGDDFLSMQCSLEAAYIDKNRAERKTKFKNLQKYHVLRQFTAPGVFRNVNGTRNLTLSGHVQSLMQEAFLHFKNLKKLVIRKTQLKYIGKNVFYGLKNLRTLLISDNSLLSTIGGDAFSGLDSLDILNISKNGLVKLEEEAFLHFKNLKKLVIRKTQLKYIGKNVFYGLEKLRTLLLSDNLLLSTIDGDAFNGLDTLNSLNISKNGLVKLEDTLLHSLSALKIIDLRGNNLRLTGNIFKHNSKLTQIYSDSYSFCCIKPPSVEENNCFAPKYDVSSCDDLIQDRVLKIFLWIIGIVAFLSNVLVLIYRFATGEKTLKETFSIFVSNLSLSDAIMGLYMLIIAAHDSSYAGEYVWKEYSWRRSTLCKVSGVMAYISSESSVMFVALITIDRFLAVKFPFGGVRLSVRHAHICSVSAWIISLLAAIVPVFVYPEFYSTSGVCIALPLTADRGQGWLYSIIIFLGFNFIVFLLVAVGQFCIFRDIQLSGKRVRSSQVNRDRTVARMLLMVVVTDCLCWIPVGIIAFIALGDIDIPHVIYAWVIVFVLPVNSAINPFLYTLVPLCRKRALEMRKKKSTCETTEQSHSIN